MELNYYYYDDDDDSTTGLKKGRKLILWKWKLYAYRSDCIHVVTNSSPGCKAKS
jgi:hypothetical protein